MVTIELQLDSETAERAREIAQERGCTLEELLKAQIDRLEPAPPRRAPKDEDSGDDPFWGLFRDIPEVIDQIERDTMNDRARRRLRDVDV